MDHPNRESIQVAAVVFILVGIVATIKFIKTHRDQWAYAVPPLTWLVHLLIFYGVIFAKNGIGLFSGIDYNLWSAVIRLQAAILIAGVMGMLAYEKLIFKT